MLAFHEQITSDSIDEDGLTILAAGIGIHKVISALVGLQWNPRNIVFILNCTESQRMVLKYEIEEMVSSSHAFSHSNGLGSQKTLPASVQFVDSQLTLNERLKLYSQGNCIFITSRILVMDLLMDRVPISQVSDVFVNNAHRITETCSEAFIIRLLKEKDYQGHVRAFSDRSQNFMGEINGLERIMRSLYLSKLYLWPRFQLNVSSCLESNPPKVIEIQIPLSKCMIEIQNAILMAMDVCLKDLKKTNKIDIEDLTVENGLFKSFDEIIYRQLSPIWNTIGKKTKQLVQDLKTLRKIAENLLRLDSVNFLKFLDDLRISEVKGSMWIFATGAEKIFEWAKRRVYKVVRTNFARKCADEIRLKDNRKKKNSRGKTSTIQMFLQSRKKQKSHNGKKSSGKKREKEKLTRDESDFEEDEDDDGDDNEENTNHKNEEEEEKCMDGKNNTEEAEGSKFFELETVLEELPKWSVLKEILVEIEEEITSEQCEKLNSNKKSNEDLEKENCSANQSEKAPEISSQNNKILIVSRDERTCVQLENILFQGPDLVLKDEWERYLIMKSELNRLKFKGNKAENTSKVQKNGPKNFRNEILAHEQSALLLAANELEKKLSRGKDIFHDQSLKISDQQQKNNDLNRCKDGENEIFDENSKDSIRDVIPSKPLINDTVLLDGGGKIDSGSQSENTTMEQVIVLGDDTDEDVKENDSYCRSSNNQSELIIIDEEGNNFDQNPRTTNDNDTILRDQDENRRKEGKQSKDEGENANPTVNYVSTDKQFSLFQNLQFACLETRNINLSKLRPKYIIVFDPDVEFLREIEVFHAESHENQVKIYFLTYENSTEMKKFETYVNKENSSFENLIRHKSVMMIPQSEDKNIPPIPSPSTLSPISKSHGIFHSNMMTRNASESFSSRKNIAASREMQIIVDMREFNSNLPCVLHQKGLKIIPATLPVGDYVLSSEICVERKSIADLFSSFSSGRLFAQAEALTRHYKLGVLLIEFVQDNCFSLQRSGDVGEDIDASNIISKICLLTLHFPRLRIVWSRNLHATADFFIELKSNQDEPDIKRAVKIGLPLDEDELIQGEYREEPLNSVAVELLRRLPGVTDSNYRLIMNEFHSLADMAVAPLEKLAMAMGGNKPAQTLQDFLLSKCPKLD